MARGDLEARCLKIVRTALFPISKWFPFRPDLENTFYTMSDASFEELYRDMKDDLPTENFIGMTENDIITVLQALRHTAESDELSKFPDFVFDGGFIEHFRVSSSSHNRKGSQQEQFNGQIRRKVDEQRKKWADDDAYTGPRSQTWQVEQANTSYDFFVSHFQDIWRNHLDSLSKYEKPYHSGIFMVDYQDNALMMQSIVRSSDPAQPKKFFYRLSRDKKLLDYIYESHNKVQYVIFVNADQVEIIKLASIPEWKKIPSNDYVIYALAMQYRQTLMQIRVPLTIEQEEDHDKT